MSILQDKRAKDESASGPKLVDVFSGCGGFSLGAHNADFRVVVAFDNDRVLASSYQYNFPNTRMVFRDVTDVDGNMIRAAAGGQVDGIVGGPPCQGFSDIGKRHPADPRSRLLCHFFRIVREVRPSFFAMENVRGLAYSNARSVLDEALQLVEDEYVILGPIMLNAAEFGAATNRSRLFVVGIHKDRGEALTLKHFDALKRAPATVKAAISDLDGAAALGQRDGFDTWRITRTGRPYNYARILRSPDGLFTGHRVTSHCGQVVARFDAVPPGVSTRLDAIRVSLGQVNALLFEPGQVLTGGLTNRSDRYTQNTHASSRLGKLHDFKVSQTTTASTLQSGTRSG